MESDIQKLNNAKKILGLVIGLGSITMLVVDYFVDEISFNSMMLIITLCISIIIFSGSERTVNNNLSPRAQKVMIMGLIVLIIVGIICAVLAM